MALRPDDITQKNNTADGDEFLLMDGVTRDLIRSPRANFRSLGFFTGTADPAAGSQYIQGDLYLHDFTYELFAYDGAAWNSRGSIRGADGAGSASLLPEFTMGGIFEDRAMVRHQGRLWVSLIPTNSGNSPENSLTEWAVMTPEVGFVTGDNIAYTPLTFYPLGTKAWHRGKWLKSIRPIAASSTQFNLNDWAEFSGGRVMSAAMQEGIYLEVGDTITAGGAYSGGALTESSGTATVTRSGSVFTCTVSGSIGDLHITASVGGATEARYPLGELFGTVCYDTTGANNITINAAFRDRPDFRLSEPLLPNWRGLSFEASRSPATKANEIRYNGFMVFENRGSIQICDPVTHKVISVFDPARDAGSTGIADPRYFHNNYSPINTILGNMFIREFLVGTPGSETTIHLMFISYSQKIEVLLLPEDPNVGTISFHHRIDGVWNPTSTETTQSTALAMPTMGMDRAVVNIQDAILYVMHNSDGIKEYTYQNADSMFINSREILGWSSAATTTSTNVEVLNEQSEIEVSGEFFFILEAGIATPAIKCFNRSNGAYRSARTAPTAKSMCMFPHATDPNILLFSWTRNTNSNTIRHATFTLNGPAFGAEINDPFFPDTALNTCGQHRSIPWGHGMIWNAGDNWMGISWDNNLMTNHMFDRNNVITEPNMTNMPIPNHYNTRVQTGLANTSNVIAYDDFHDRLYCVAGFTTGDHLIPTYDMSNNRMVFDALAMPTGGADAYAVTTPFTAATGGRPGSLLILDGYLWHTSTVTDRIQIYFLDLDGNGKPGYNGRMVASLDPTAMSINPGGMTLLGGDTLCMADINNHIVIMFDYADIMVDIIANGTGTPLVWTGTDHVIGQIGILGTAGDISVNRLNRPATCVSTGRTLFVSGRSNTNTSDLAVYKYEIGAINGGSVSVQLADDTLQIASLGFQDDTITNFGTDSEQRALVIYRDRLYISGNNNDFIISFDILSGTYTQTTQMLGTVDITANVQGYGDPTDNLIAQARSMVVTPQGLGFTSAFGWHLFVDGGIPQVSVDYHHNASHGYSQANSTSPVIPGAAGTTLDVLGAVLTNPPTFGRSGEHGEVKAESKFFENTKHVPTNVAELLATDPYYVVTGDIALDVNQRKLVSAKVSANGDVYWS